MTTQDGTYQVECDKLRINRGKKTVLNDLTMTLRPGVITGLVGPNAAGKTTLATALAGRLRPVAGTITVSGEAPYENAQLMPKTALVGDGCEYLARAAVKHTISMWAAVRAEWNAELATDILNQFGIGPKDKPHKMSLGQKSGLAFALGMGAQAPLTMYDEVTVGMDATNRERYCERVLDDYAANPRTTVISSHLIDEIENLVEDLVVVREGAVVYQGLVSDLRENVVALEGPSDKTSRLLGQRSVLRRRDLGPTTQHTLIADDELRANAAAEGISVESVSLQHAVIALTGSDAPTTEMQGA